MFGKSTLNEVKVNINFWLLFTLEDPKLFGHITEKICDITKI